MLLLDPTQGAEHDELNIRMQILQNLGTEFKKVNLLNLETLI